MDAITKAPAESNVVCAGLRDAQVINEDARFHALLSEERAGLEYEDNDRQRAP